VFTSDPICRVYKVWTFDFGRAFSKAGYQHSRSLVYTSTLLPDKELVGSLREGKRERRTWTKTFLLVVPP
jgi:hypothetical protein